MKCSSLERHGLGVFGSVQSSFIGFYREIDIPAGVICFGLNKAYIFQKFALKDDDAETLGNDLGLSTESSASASCDEEAPDSSNNAVICRNCTSGGTKRSSNCVIKHTSLTVTMQEFFCEETQTIFFEVAANYCLK